MRVGTVCYATSRGLGHLARDFHRRGLITDVMVVRHPSVPTNEDWYPDSWHTDLRRSDVTLMKNFAASCGAMLFFETPFHWPLLDECRRMGVKTYLVTMYECTPVNHVRPDVYLCPSLLDCEYFMGPDARPVPFVPQNGINESTATLVQLPVEYPWRRRERAEHFVHNGGYLGVKARGGVTREGTTTVIEAMRYVRSPIRLTIRVQENVPAVHQKICAADKRIEYLPRTVPYEELYGTGDVCVGAQRWNGCSLPLQEAFASGMLVMNTDRFPVNTWLPRPPLVPVARYVPDSRVQNSGAYLSFDEANVTPQAVAETIDAWYGKYITYYSERGREWAAENSWEALLPKWRGVLGL